MRLRIVNCIHRDNRVCRAGHFGGTPSPLTCELCETRVRNWDGPAIFEVLGDDPASAEAPRFDGSHLWADWYGRAKAFTGDADAERAWIADRLIPALSDGGCGCRGHAKTMLDASPPDLTNASTYADSIGDYHNRTNARLGRPEWTSEQRIKRWGV